MNISLRISTSEDMDKENPCETIVLTIPDNGCFFGGKEGIAQIMSDPDNTNDGEFFCFYLDKKDMLKMARRIIGAYQMIDSLT
jgi:hypothetical protein